MYVRCIQRMPPRLLSVVNDGDGWGYSGDGSGRQDEGWQVQLWTKIEGGSEICSMACTASGGMGSRDSQVGVSVSGMYRHLRYGMK